MRAAVFALSLLLCAPAWAGRFLDGELVVDGQKVAVRWNDGDSFGFTDGPLAGKRARLMDVNALENYGPVHRWGDWSRWELYQLSLMSAETAVQQAWTCTVTDRPDRFGRLLVRCPGLARELVRQGHAMVFAIDDPPRPDLLAAQRDAQKRGAGMWKKGVPSKIVSGAHSSLEGEGEGYDRIVDTRTGRAQAVKHSNAYETCEDVCVGQGKGASCLVYVPFRRRYRDPPPCLTNPKVEPLPPQPRRPPP
jgi:endonuclease YncB( thermonuclease family)